MNTVLVLKTEAKYWTFVQSAILPFVKSIFHLLNLNLPKNLK